MTEDWGSTGQAGRRERRAWLWWLLAIGVLIVVALVSLALDAYYQFQPPAASGIVRVNIAEGESVTALANDLEAKRRIRSALLFKLYVRQQNAGPLIRAGIYAIPAGMTIPQILQMFENGDTVDTSIHVTFPEGFTADQMAQRLQAEHICTAKAFLDEVNHGKFNEPFLKQIHLHKGIRYRYEGYLFPDTYDFTKHESAHQVVDTILESFQQNAVPLLANSQSGLTSLGKMITVASMVESEAKMRSELPIIASVIYNRLHRNPPMKLQIDATVEYALGHHTNIVTYGDLNVQSPYNTYRHTGLPLGPISNPGVAAIQAALEPKHTHYLYYVAKNDGSGGHYFSETMQEQVLNEQKAQANAGR